MILKTLSFFVALFFLSGCAPRVSKPHLKLHTVPAVSLQDRERMAERLETVYQAERSSLERAKRTLLKEALSQDAGDKIFRNKDKTS